MSPASLTSSTTTSPIQPMPTPTASGVQAVPPKRAMPYTLISEEDTLMVRSIERALGTKVERRIVKGFDYNQVDPQRNNEFARPPREPRGRRPQAPRPSAPQSPRPAQQPQAPPLASPTDAFFCQHRLLPASTARIALPKTCSDRPSQGAPNSNDRRHRRPRSRSGVTA